MHDFLLVMHGLTSLDIFFSDLLIDCFLQKKIEVAEKPLPKANSRASPPTKRVNTSGNVDEPDKLSTSRASLVRRSLEVSNGGLPSNLVKIPASRRKLTEVGISWSSLPSSLSKLGKVKLLHQNLYILFFITNLD